MYMVVATTEAQLTPKVPSVSLMAKVGGRQPKVMMQRPPKHEKAIVVALRPKVLISQMESRIEGIWNIKVFI